MWSEERNIVRRVLDFETRPHTLRPIRPAFRTIETRGARNRRRRRTAQRDRATGRSGAIIRSCWFALLEREYPGAKIESISAKADLEHSFSPVYTRGVIRTGQSAFAVLGVNADESQASIDAALTFGILWLDYHRQRADRYHIEGLKLFVPTWRGEIVSQRMAHLDQSAVKWQLYQVGERIETCEELDFRDHGNLATRLVRAVDPRPRATLRRIDYPH